MTKRSMLRITLGSLFIASTSVLLASLNNYKSAEVIRILESRGGVQYGTDRVSVRPTLASYLPFGKLPVRNIRVVAFHNSEERPNLPALCRYPEIERLSVIAEKIELSALPCLVNLVDLRITTTRLEAIELQKLTAMSRLSRLSIYDAQLPDVRPIAALCTLRELDLARCRVRDVTPIQYLHSLERLELRGSSVENLAFISQLTKVETLGLGQTSITDIAAIRSLANLERIELDHTNVRDLSPLANCRNLTDVLLPGTPTTSQRELMKAILPHGCRIIWEAEIRHQ